MLLIDLRKSTSIAEEMSVLHQHSTKTTARKVAVAARQRRTMVFDPLPTVNGIIAE